MENNSTVEKAKELVEKFLPTVKQECENESYCDREECCYNGTVYCVVNIGIAKQCALICVDEIIETVVHSNHTGAVTKSSKEYWESVKTAIEQIN